MTTGTTHDGALMTARDPDVQVVRGTPDDLELAALVAGLMAAASERARLAEEREHAVAAPWADRRRTMRGTPVGLRPGPDAWRWSLRA